MDTVREFLGITEELWDTANWLMRTGIGLIAGIFFLIVVVAFFGSPMIVSWFTLAMLAFGLLFIQLSRFDPAIIAILAVAEKGRVFLKGISTLIGVEIGIGIYFSVVPVRNNRGLVALALLLFLSLLSLSLGDRKEKGFSIARKALFVGLLLVTSLFYYDWTGRAQEWLTGPREMKTVPVLFQKGGHYEDGLYVNPEPTTVKEFAKRETKADVQAGGRFVNLLYNCDDNRKVADVEPHQTVEIVHVVKNLDMDNRCSYNYTGSSYPVFGAIGHVILPRYKNNVPFPDLPGYAVVFQLRSASGKILAQDYMRHIGGRITFINDSDEKAELWVIYNNANSVQNELVGWDGSTASFTIMMASR